MASLRTSFAVLEDPSTQAGVPLHKVLPGDAFAGKNALEALVAKDPSNNLQLLNLDVSGNLKTVSVSSSACLSGKGTQSGATGFTTVATVTLVASKMYTNIGWIAGCTRDAEFKIVHNDNGSPTDIALGIFTGAGCETSAAELSCLNATAGGTGTQELWLQAKCLDALSDMSGTISAEQV